MKPAPDSSCVRATSSPTTWSSAAATAHRHRQAGARVGSPLRRGAPGLRAAPARPRSDSLTSRASCPTCTPSSAPAKTPPDTRTTVYQSIWNPGVTYTDTWIPNRSALAGPTAATGLRGRLRRGGRRRCARLGRERDHVDEPVDEAARAVEGDRDTGGAEPVGVGDALVAERVESGDQDVGGRQARQIVGEQRRYPVTGPVGRIGNVVLGEPVDARSAVR